MADISESVLKTLRYPFETPFRKKRTVGIILFIIILALFFSFNRLPKLDIVGEDLDALTAPAAQCFQGFCIEREAGTSLLSRWWTFSVTYLRLVSMGMTFAFVVAGLAEAFLFPPDRTRGFASGSVFSRTLRGAAAGPVMNLCSACIVPISSAFRKRAGIEGAISMVQGSATMNIPALAMAFFVFTPILGFSRLFMAVIGALIIGPIVVMTVRRELGPTMDIPITTADEPEQNQSNSWKPILIEGFRNWGKTSIGYLARMGPIMILAGFASGLAIQWLSPSTVASYLGNDLLGIGIAATFGILINVPLLFEIPLVALLLLLGMGTAPAATLLFAAAAGGPVTFWGLAKIMPLRATATFAGATWIVGVLGGLAVLGIGSLIWDGASTNARIEKAEERQASLKFTHAIEPSERPIFIDVTKTAGIDFLHSKNVDDGIDLGAGVIIFDYNNDGWQDIYITNNNGLNALYQNNKDGTFTDIASQAGVNNHNHPGEANGGCAADYDNDGDQDLFVSHLGPDRLFNNDGNGKFRDVTRGSFKNTNVKSRSTGCAWGDYDKDGFLDLVITSHIRFGEGDSLYNPQASKVQKSHELINAHDPISLYHNNGDGTFSNVTTFLGDTSKPDATGHIGNVWGSGFQPAWIDYDDDGDIDLYVVNDFGIQVQPNVLWRNDGRTKDNRWAFVDVSNVAGAGVEMFGMGLAIGDYNLDGSLDMFVTNIGDNVLLKNKGHSPGFINSTIESGSGVGFLPDRSLRVAWSTFFFDYDNDRDEDLYIVSGFLNSKDVNNSIDQPNVLLRNNGDASFTDISPGSHADQTGAGRGGVYLDYDNDGCLDILVVNMRGKATLLRNLCESARSWLEIKLIGTKSNRDGIGARITVVTGSWALMKETAAGSGQMSQNMLRTHFGLGPAQIADYLLVQWPSGKLQTLRNVPLNQIITIREPS